MPAFGLDAPARSIVRLHTRMPSLSSSPRMRSAPERGLRPAISRMSAARVVGGRPDRRERRRQNARNPARCQRRMVAGWGCFTPSWRDSRGENNREALPGRPPDAPGNLPLGDDELLSKKRVLGDQFDATANEIRGQSENESKKVDHGSSLTLSARLTCVARTGDYWITKVAYSDPLFEGCRLDSSLRGGNGGYIESPDLRRTRCYIWRPLASGLGQCLRGELSQRACPPPPGAGMGAIGRIAPGFHR